MNMIVNCHICMTLKMTFRGRLMLIIELSTVYRFTHDSIVICSSRVEMISQDRELV